MSDDDEEKLGTSGEPPPSAEGMLELDLGKLVRNNKVSLPLRFTREQLKVIREALDRAAAHERRVQAKFSGSLYYNLSVIAQRQQEELIALISRVLEPLQDADAVGYFPGVYHVDAKGSRLGAPRWFCDLACLVEHVDERFGEALEATSGRLQEPGLICHQCGKPLDPAARG
jgi:hypothetical protein